MSFLISTLGGIESLSTEALENSGGNVDSCLLRAVSSCGFWAATPLYYLSTGFILLLLEMFEDLSPTDSPPILSCCLVAKSCPTLGDPMDCTTPDASVHHLPEFDQTRVHQVADAIQPSHSLSPLSPPAFNLSQHQGLSQWVNSSHQMAEVLELQLQHQSFQWRFGLISFRIDWFDLLALQGTLRSLLQHHNLKASILRHSAFFMVRTWLLEKP